MDHRVKDASENFEPKRRTTFSAFGITDTAFGRTSHRARFRRFTLSFSPTFAEPVSQITRCCGNDSAFGILLRTWAAASRSRGPVLFPDAVPLLALVEAERFRKNAVHTIRFRKHNTFDFLFSSIGHRRSVTAPASLGKNISDAENPTASSHRPAPLCPRGMLSPRALRHNRSIRSQRRAAVQAPSSSASGWATMAARAPRTPYAR